MPAQGKRLVTLSLRTCSRTMGWSAVAEIWTVWGKCHARDTFHLYKTCIGHNHSFDWIRTSHLFHFFNVIWQDWFSRGSRLYLNVTGCFCVFLFYWGKFIFRRKSQFIGFGLLMTLSLNYCFSSTLMSHDKMEFIGMPGLVETEQFFQHTTWKNKTIATPIDVVDMCARRASPLMV